MAKVFKRLLQLQIQAFFTEVEIADDGTPTLSQSRNSQPFGVTGKEFEEMDKSDLVALVDAHMNAVFPDENGAGMNRQMRRAIEREAAKNGGELHAVDDPKVDEPAEENVQV